MILQILLSFLVLCYLIMRYKDRRIYELSRQLNNDILTLPFLGHLYLFVGNSEDRMKSLQYFGRKALKNGGVAAMWCGTKLFTVVADPVTVEYLSKTHLEKDDLTNIGQSLIGNGSIFAPVSIWRPRRKSVALNFSTAKLNIFVDIFSKQSQFMVKKLKTLEERKTISMFKYFTAYSMDSICESTLGVEIGVQNDSKHPFPKAFEYQCEMYGKQMFVPYIYKTPFYKFTSGYDVFKKNNCFMRDFVQKLITSKRQELEDDNKNKTGREQNREDKKQKTFLEMMIHQSGPEQGFSDLEILEESLVLILAGTDTSATGAAFIALMLSRHPEVQDKVYQELQEVFDDSDRPVTANDLTQVKYLDAVVKECLRLYPPVPITFRKI